MLIAWHPNGMIDPALIFAQFPYHLVFGARHGLFKWPFLGDLFRSMGTVPIYRKKDLRKLDPKIRVEKNNLSLDALSQSIAKGRFSAIFPEGLSHDEPHLKELKTGAARIYYRSRELMEDGPVPAIIPVGLHYDKKHAFRSKALVVFHPPLELPPSLDRTEFADEQHKFECQIELTKLIQHQLTEVVCAMESWEIHALFFQAGNLVHAERTIREGNEPCSPTLKEQVIGLYRLWKGYQSRMETHPEEVELLIDDIEYYVKTLDSLGIRSHEIDIDKQLLTSKIFFQLMIHFLLIVLVLPPLIVVGYIVNFPTAFGIHLLAKNYSNKGKDIASVKTFSGLIFFPITWIIWSALSSWGYAQSFLPQMSSSYVIAFLSSFFLCVLSAIVLFTYVGFTKRTFLSIKLRITKSARKRTIRRMKKTRSQLYDRLIALRDGLELPKIEDYH